MKKSFDLLGIYGPDLLVLGLLIVLAVIISSAVDLIGGLESAGGVVGLVAMRLVAQWRAVVKQVSGTAKQAAMGMTVKPLKRVAGLLFGSPVAIVAIGLAILIGLGWLGWRATDERPVVAGAGVLAAAGLGGQWLWFRRSVSEWKAANPTQ